MECAAVDLCTAHFFIKSHTEVKIMKKRLLSVLLSVCMVTAILPTFSSTAFAAGTVTRSEWISRLVEAFSMTVESDDNMPDNYFSDISEDDSCYQDILLAVEFGVIDLEAGEAFEPDADATREFAAQTLNSCLQFQLDEDEEYTYSEADIVAYPDDIQIAINRNWFALSGSNFLPEQAVTTTEADAMLADAAEVIAGDVIDENYENKFEFAEGVIEIPESADVTIDENNTVTITGNDKEINVGDVFVVYSMGIPVALKATTVETADGATIISATKDGAENAIVSADAQGRIAIGIENFKPEEATTYSILNTKTNQTEEMGIQLCEIDYDKDTSTVTASHNITIGAGIAGSIVAKISNIYLDYKKDGLDFEVILTGDVNITTSVSFDFNDYAGIPKSVRLGSVPVAGIGKIALDVECSISGGIAMSWDGALKAGVEGTVFKDIRFIKSFTKKDFTVTAEVNIGLGLKLSAGVDIFIASGTIFAEIGANGSVKATGYSSGTPVECATIKAYMYASVGADVKILGWKPNIQPIDIFTEKNSPIRACYHYEDGKLVGKCTRGAAEAGDAYTAYTTPTNSKYFNPSPSYGQSSYGGSGSSSGGASEPVVIWEYELDDDNNATIIGYKGNASAIAIPSKIDGYTVTKIGDSAFSNNTLLRTVSMPNTVEKIEESAFKNCATLSTIKFSSGITTIDEEAFLGCSSLTSIYLPEGLSRLGYSGNSWGSCGVFKNCSSLTTVYIPSTLKDVETFANDEYGNFYGCNQLKNVIWGDGITAVPDGLFRGCSGIETISIPNTVISINPTAFTSCESLVSIDIPNSVTTIGNNAFENCTSLKEIDIPNSVTTIDEEAFLGCTSLTEIVIPDSVTSMEDYIFSNCSNLKKIDIPKTVTAIRSNAFSGCSKLENVVFPASLETIENNAFYECSSLEEINIPSSVTSVGSSAFYNCDSLTSVTTDMTGSIGAQAFYDCDALTTLELGDGATEIGREMCYGCDKLSTVKLGKYITTIPDSAFRLCQSLETITLPRFCTTVAANAFAEDTKLASAYVPVSVSKIETTSFSYPMKMTMYGKAGSYAEEYAGSRNMAFNAVNAPITSIKYADSSMSIGRNATVRPQLDIEPTFDTSVVTFSTSDDKILTVSDTGLVRGVNYGTATITATTDSGKSTSIEITVLKTATKLELDKTSLSLEQGQSDTLSVTMTPSDAADKLNWSSSNSEVATVDENGKITAVGVGTAVITVTAEYSGVSASCTVEVVGDVTITASAGEHGKINPSGEVSVKSNAKTTFTIIPDYGYVVKDVQVNGASVGAVESYTFSNPKDNATIHADFAAVNVSYENGDVVISSEAALNNLKLIVAEYNDDNSLSDCKIETVTAEPNVEHHVSVSPTGKYKLMLWSSMDTMRPVWMSASV